MIPSVVSPLKKSGFRAGFQFLAFFSWGVTGGAADLTISEWTRSGGLTLTNTYAEGILTIEKSHIPTGPWIQTRHIFTTQTQVQLTGVADGDHANEAQAYFRAQAGNLRPEGPNDKNAFTNLVHSYNLLTTVAGAGGIPDKDVNKWLPQFEGGPATNALLSRPHIALGDDAGNIYIADKDAHAIRMVRPNGIIVTVAGTGQAENGTDNATVATNVALNGPNGLWVEGDGTVYILDTGNSKVRKLETNGLMNTLFTDPAGIFIGRGLWVNDDASHIFYSSQFEVKQWSTTNGITRFASGFSELGNLAVHPISRELVATDRDGLRVWQMETDGSRFLIAGNGATFGGGDGSRALDTGLNEPRGITFLPSGAYFLATHRGSRIWYVDTLGYIHLFVNGLTSDTHGGDHTWFFNLGEFRISEPRAITADRQGNLLITENDSGYIRKIEFKRHYPD